jgi:hypothetical protein
MEASQRSLSNRVVLLGDVSCELPLNPIVGPRLDRAGSRRARRGIVPGLTRSELARHPTTACRNGAEIEFIGETGCSFQIGTGTTGATKGQTPELLCVSKRHEVTTASELTASSAVNARHFDDQAIRGEDTVTPLKHLGRDARGLQIIVCDRLHVHRSRVVKAFFDEHVEIDAEWLTSNAAELNVEERCHGDVKDRMKSVSVQTVAETLEQVDRVFGRLCCRTGLLLGFFCHADLRTK